MMEIERYSESTAWRLIKYLGYYYSYRKKSYYNDKHESSQNIEYSKKFIRRYFEFEKRAHVWVQIHKDEAKRMEEERGLLPGIGYRVDDTQC